MRFRIIFFAWMLGKGKRMEPKDLKLLRIRSLAQVLMILLGVILVQILCAALWMAVTSLLHDTTDSSTKLMQMSLASAFLTMIWCGMLYYHSTWRIRPFDYRQAFSGKMIPSFLGVGVGGCIVVALVLSVVQMLFPRFFVGYQQTMDQFEQGETLLTLVYVLLVGPAAEELIFRGAILDRLRLAYPFWVANLLQAAFFGLYHMNVIQGIYAFLCGLLLGLVCRAADTILANILTHIAFNATNYLLGYLFPADKAVSVPQYLVTFLVGVVCFAAGLWYTIQAYTKKRETVKTSDASDR